MAANTYRPKDVIVTVGSNTISGFSDDSMIELEPASEDFIRTLGVDGFISRAKIEDTAWTITLYLQQTSPSNDILTGYSKQDRQNNQAFRFDISDLAGTTKVSASYAWIASRPTLTMGRDVGTYEWIIHTDNSDYNIGNNFTPGIQNGN